MATARAKERLFGKFHQILVHSMSVLERVTECRVETRGGPAARTICKTSAS